MQEKKCGDAQWHDFASGEREKCSSPTSNGPESSGENGKGDDEQNKNRDKDRVNPGSGDDIKDGLSELGIDFKFTPRLDSGGKTLPDDFAPLGAARDLRKFDELYLVGFKVPSGTKRAQFLKRHPASPAIEATEDQPAVAAKNAKSEILHVPEVTQWVASTRRQVAAGDVDGDGRDEIVGVHLDSDGKLKFHVTDDSVGDFSVLKTGDLGSYVVKHMAMVAGDFDGDGKDEMVVAIVVDTSVKILLLDDAASDFALLGESAEFFPTKSSHKLDLDLTAGSIDYDASDELGLVINERFQDSLGNDAGLSRYFVLDDSNQKFKILREGDFAARDGVLHTAVSGGISFGDIDGDNVDEIVLGGLTDFSTENKPISYLVFALDDAPRGLALLGARHHQHYQGDGDNAISPNKFYRAYVKTLDIDGDLLKEIVVNHLVFDDFFATRSASNPFGDDASKVWKRLPDSAFAPASAGYAFDIDNTAMAVADINRDGNMDILLMSPIENAIQVWGISAAGFPDAGSFKKIDAIPIEDLTLEAKVQPIIVPVNVDDDSIRVQFVKANTEYVFTEPLLIAAVAAAPCHGDGGQLTSACVTSFGKATSQSVKKEESLTISASLHVGFSAEDRIFTQSAVEVEATVSTSVGLSRNNSYKLEETITYATGGLEDGVVFSTIPFDRYTYKIQSHPDTDLVGRDVIVSLPRTPITLKVERSFYNAHVSEGSILVDEKIFKHVPGDISSYPSRGDKDALLMQYGGFGSSESRSVGQGTGTTEIALATNQEYGIAPIL